MKNTTAFSSEEYDEKIKQTLPYYEEFYKQIADAVGTYFDRKVAWLDVGCGVGKMAELGLELSYRFALCDISADMLEAARARVVSGKAEFILSSAQEIEYENEFDVVTAIQTFHYLPPEKRKKAVRKCYRALKPKGMFITFENFAPDTGCGKRLYLERWKRYQIERGRSERESRNHILRYGKDYFPITIDEHKKVMKESGFEAVELLWCSYMQAGFIGIK